MTYVLNCAKINYLANTIVLVSTTSPPTINVKIKALLK